MKKLVRPMVICLALALLLSLCGCGVSKDEIMNVIAPTEAPQQQEQTAPRPVETETEDMVRTENCRELTGCFSPFWAETDGDRLVAEATQLSLLDEQGGEGPAEITVTENSDGTVTVSIEIRGGLRFSDGDPLDADDLIFTLYVLLDRDYSGPCQVNTLPIAGLEEYYNGVPTALYEKYGKLYDELYDGGHYDETLRKALQEAKDAVPHNSWDESQAQKAFDEYDQDKAEEIRQAIRASWQEDVQDIVDFCMENFGNTVEYHTGYTLEQVKADEGLQVMFAMVEWSLASLTPDGVLVNRRTGDIWDMQNEKPTLADLYLELYESYDGDAERYWQVEGIGRSSMLDKARNSVIAAWAAQDEAWTGPVSHISGIDRAGDRLVSVTLTSGDADAAETLTDIFLAPMHWYGDEALYDYAAGSFGFVKGDLGSVRERNGEPLGAGAYVLTDYQEGVAMLAANSEYWGGEADKPLLEITVK